MFVCGKIGRESLTRLGVPPARILAMSPGVAAPRARRAPGQERAFRPLRFFFASDHPFRDGVRVLFDAWNSVRFPDCQLHCAINKTALTAPHLLRLLVANPTIIVHEAPEDQSAEQLVALMMEMDYLVHPSYFDDVTLYVRYGMTLGRPAIVSHGTSVADEIRDGGNGYIVEELTTDALAVCLSRARNAHADFTALERATMNTAACWSWDRVANSLVTWRDTAVMETQ
jgi:glycosyltransferase involved in cell wall biosynthesis